MQTGIADNGANTDDVVRVTSADGRWTAEFLPKPAGWMAGAITGHVFEDDDDRRKYLQEVVDSVRQVMQDELAYSSCTDGRKRVNLVDGQQVPVREQVVGTDTMCAFVAAEALGAHFYGDDLYQPVEVRIRRVIRHLMDNGYMPTAHIACGAAGGFTTVINRATQFIKDKSYVERMQALTGGDYSDTLHYLIVGSYQSRLDSGVYDGYRDGLVSEIVQELVGGHAVEVYDDDGRGVHGHREQMIVYLDESARGYAVDPNALINTGDHQVFAVNVSRIDDLAKVMSGDDQYGIDYRTARLAIEDFSCAGHGTLAANIETVIVSAAGRS